MKITYSDGSFMLAWDRVRAWYYADGSLKDAEYRRHNGRTATVASNHRNVRSYLMRQGINELKNPNHKRHVADAKEASERVVKDFSELNRT